MNALEDSIVPSRLAFALFQLGEAFVFASIGIPPSLRNLKWSNPRCKAAYCKHPAQAGANKDNKDKRGDEGAQRLCIGFARGRPTAPYRFHNPEAIRDCGALFVWVPTYSVNTEYLVSDQIWVVR